jgi:PKD repeat protein
MTITNPTDLALLRSRPHETNLWLSIYKPPVIFTAQVNDNAAAPGLREVTYDNGVGTQPVNVGDWEGMTMYVGSTPGARDVGKIRVRRIVGNGTGVITVAENSDINWDDDLYLTIVKFIEISAVYPRMVADPLDETNVAWFKDYDITGTTQNNELGMFICMGPHHAAFVGEDIYFTSTGTYSLMGNGMSYSWTMVGSNNSTSVDATPGVRHYDTPGFYTVKLTVSDTTTFVSDTSYRHISIYDKPGDVSVTGSMPPILNWELISLDGSRDMGGYQARIKIRENISDVVDGALVILFSDDTYGSTKGSIGGNAINRSTNFFVGYILEGSITYNYQDSSAEFTVGSPTEVMKLSQGFVVAVDSSTDPAAQDIVDNDYPSIWALLINMDCKRAIYHYLRWHSTVLMTNDFQFIGTDHYIEYFDADRESLYDAINNFLKGTLYGELVCDRQGKLFAGISAATLNTTLFTNVAIDITKQDWIGSPSIEESFNYRLGYMEMGGIYFDPTTPSDPIKKPYSGSWLPYLSCSPGTVPGYHGNVQTIEGLAIDSQDYLNNTCGNVFAYLNSKYAHVGIELSGNYRNLDIAPLEVVTLNLEANDNPKRLVWVHKKFHITEMSWTYDPQKGTLLPNITLHEVTSSYPGTAIVIPPVAPNTDPGGGGYTPPPIYIPPIVIPPFTGFLYVYHNGILVAVVSALNFIDSA